MSSLELQTIELAPTKAPYSDMVLSYKYTALHPRMISTARGFPAAPTRPTPLPRGYCEFSFAVQEAKMKDTFGKHLVKVLMKEAGVRLGTADIDLSGLLCQPLVKGRRSLASQVTTVLYCTVLAGGRFKGSWLETLGGRP